MLLYGALNFNCNSQVTNNFGEKDKLTLVSKIILPGVSGRIDHITYDPLNHLAFIAALGNNTVEVVNTNTKQVVHTITGLHEPQGILYVSSISKLIVANGDNGDCIFFDTDTYTQSGIVHLKNDADNIRYDAASHLLYAGYGSGSIAVIDANTMKQVADIVLDGHPESFQLSKNQNHIYINVPDANEIEVADLSTNKVIAKWKNITASSNFPMALGEENNRLFIGCRSPGTLRMINTQTGKDIISISCSGDAVIFFIMLQIVLFLFLQEKDLLMSSEQMRKNWFKLTISKQAVGPVHRFSWLRKKNFYLPFLHMLKTLPLCGFTISIKSIYGYNLTSPKLYDQ
jgi:YVTN family beta-propeller protein